MSNSNTRLTAGAIRDLKGRSKFAVLTAYDYPSALMADQAGIPVLLVGDSRGMVVAGKPDTLTVTVDEIVDSCAAVVRGAQRALVVADMPFMSYQACVSDAVRNAGRMVREGGAQAVKLEGGMELTHTIERIVAAGIPVVGHVGLMPQYASLSGDFSVRGRDPESAKLIMQDALAVEQAGAFAVLLELVDERLAAKITKRLTVPTIGIGSGYRTDAQVQVWHDLLGIHKHAPKHATRYADLNTVIGSALERYAQDVAAGRFPGK